MGGCGGWGRRLIHLHRNVTSLWLGLSVCRSVEYLGRGGGGDNYAGVSGIILCSGHLQIAWLTSPVPPAPSSHTTGPAHSTSRACTASTVSGNFLITYAQKKLVLIAQCLQFVQQVQAILCVQMYNAEKVRPQFFEHVHQVLCQINLCLYKVLTVR